MTVALGIGGLLLVAAGVPPVDAYRVMFRETYGHAYGLSETLVKATPLILCGLGVMVALKAEFWNIGAEGQLYIGGCAATAAATWPTLGDEPPVRLLVMVLASAAAGGAWGAIPAVLRVTRGVNEVLSSLLLNYVAIAVTGYLVYGPWRDPSSGNFPLSPLIPESARLGRLFGLRVNWAFGLALAAVLVMYVLQERSRLGYAMRVVGDNPTAARYAGINVAGIAVAVMAMGGALAGLAGMGEVAGIQHRLIPTLSSGYGYMGIVVALLGRLHPVGVAVAGVFIGGLLSGGEVLQITRRVPLSIVFMFEGLLLFSLIGTELLLRGGLPRSWPSPWRWSRPRRPEP